MGYLVTDTAGFIGYHLASTVKKSSVSAVLRSLDLESSPFSLAFHHLCHPMRACAHASG